MVRTSTKLKNGRQLSASSRRHAYESLLLFTIPWCAVGALAPEARVAAARDAVRVCALWPPIDAGERWALHRAQRLLGVDEEIADGDATERRSA